jgi:hypothetical protein
MTRSGSRLPHESAIRHETDLLRSPAATDDELAQRYTDYSAECYAILQPFGLLLRMASALRPASACACPDNDMGSGLDGFQRVRGLSAG